jgi:urease accessory protein
MPDTSPIPTKLMTSPRITDTALVRLLAWLSPAFPTGGFAYSHGLEWAIQAGDVRDEAAALDWITDILSHGAGRSDAILLRYAHRARSHFELQESAELAAASLTSLERQQESCGQGSAFLNAAAAWGTERLGGVAERLPYAVAVGAVSALHGVDEDAACIGFLQTFAANLVSASVRLVPLGQSVGLRILAALEPTILSLAASTRDAGLNEIGGCVFRSDIAAMRHETQYTRLFRS